MIVKQTILIIEMLEQFWRVGSTEKEDWIQTEPVCSLIADVA